MVATAPVMLNAATEAILTIRPARFCSMSLRATSQDNTHGPTKFVSNTASVSSSDILMARSASGMPALLIKIWMVPSFSSASESAARILSLEVISSGMGSQTPPSARISSASASNRSTRRPVSATLAPQAASTLAKRLPRPDVVPVTKAT